MLRCAFCPPGLIVVVSAAAAKLAYEQLRDDEGDLYEANGQATACLLRDLVGVVVRGFCGHGYL